MQYQWWTILKYPGKLGESWDCSCDDSSLHAAAKQHVILPSAM